MALDEARRHLGHHQLTDLLRCMTSHDPGRSGVVPTTVAVKALADALSKDVFMYWMNYDIYIVLCLKDRHCIIIIIVMNIAYIHKTPAIKMS